MMIAPILFSTAAVCGMVGIQNLEHYKKYGTNRTFAVLQLLVAGMNVGVGFTIIGLELFELL